MVSKGQFVGLDWNRITRLHSQVMIGFDCLLGVPWMEVKPGFQDPEKVSLSPD